MQASKVEQFHMSRIIFAIREDGKFLFTMNDKRSHEEWLKETYNISDEEFNSIIRGYISSDKIVFYSTQNFTPVDFNKVGLDSLIHIKALLNAYPKVDDTNCYNGVIAGEPGEVWETIEDLGSLKKLIENKKRKMGE